MAIVIHSNEMIRTLGWVRKSVKIRMKISFRKKLSNFIQTLTFFDKVSGINMMKFQPNWITFYKIKLYSENDY